MDFIKPNLIKDILNEWMEVTLIMLNKIMDADRNQITTKSHDIISALQGC